MGGSVSHSIPAGRTSTYPFHLRGDPGPGRVALTLRTDRSSVPATTEVSERLPEFVGKSPVTGGMRLVTVGRVL